jgi:hypothetical protein
MTSERERCPACERYEAALREISQWKCSWYAHQPEPCGRCQACIAVEALADD